MIGFRRRIIIAEMTLATHLGALGKMWAASAARRLGKLSGRKSGGEGFK